MKSVVNFAFGRASRIIVGGSIFASFYIAFLTLGPGLESKSFPVVRYETPSIQRNGNVLTINTTFDKLRDCEYVQSQWYLGDPQRPQDGFEMIRHAYADNPSGGPITRPVGVNRARDWTLILPNGKSPRTFFTILHYRCGLPWLTTTIQGPYPIPGG